MIYYFAGFGGNLWICENIYIEQDKTTECPFICYGMMVIIGCNIFCSMWKCVSLYNICNVLLENLLNSKGDLLWCFIILLLIKFNLRFTFIHKLSYHMAFLTLLCLSFINKSNTCYTVYKKTT